ncbi:MAG: hypothetical protein K0U74_13110 [Alphaproteobacteria bacterium]|nr:hypothetical protein [Alphaproteobacteria bacterium]
MGNNYYKLIWAQNLGSNGNEEPVIFYYEVDENDRIKGIVHIYADGTLAYASESESGSIPTIIPYQNLEPFSSNIEAFRTQEDTFLFESDEETFEKVWLRAKGQHN